MGVLIVCVLLFFLVSTVWGGWVQGKDEARARRARRIRDQRTVAHSQRHRLRLEANQRAIAKQQAEVEAKRHQYIDANEG